MNKASLHFGVNCGRQITLALLINLVLAAPVAAESVQLSHGDLLVNATINKPVTQLAGKRLYFILHGTMAHNGMEIIAALLEAFTDTDQYAMAATLSLGISDRTGMYSCDQPHSHCHEDAEKELTLWLDWLEKQDIKDVILVGHSRGASQVVDYLTQSNDKRVSAAILLAPQTAGKLTASNAEDLSLAKQYLETNRSLDFIPVNSFLHCGPSEVAARSFLSYYSDQSNKDILTKLSQLNLPVQLYLGSEDTVVLPAHWLEHANKLAPTTKLVVLDGADHFFRDLYVYDIVEQSVERFEQ